MNTFFIIFSIFILLDIIINCMRIYISLSRDIEYKKLMLFQQQIKINKELLKDLNNFKNIDKYKEDLEILYKTSHNIMGQILKRNSEC